MGLQLAAHVDCTISHSYADLGSFIGYGVGGSVGIVVGLWLTLGSVGLAAGVAVEIGTAITSFGGWLGEKIASVFGECEDSGHIAKGAQRTFYGEQKKAAARMTDRTACFSPGMAVAEPLSIALTAVAAPFAIVAAFRMANRSITGISMWWNGEELLPTDSQPGAHPGSKIADGAATVLIETKPAARKGDGVAPCAGKISSGIESILIGGPTAVMKGTENRSEIDFGQKIFGSAVELAGTIASLIGSRALIEIALALAWLTSQIGDYGNMPWVKRSGDVATNVLNVIKALRYGDLKSVKGLLDEAPGLNDLIKLTDHIPRAGAEEPTFVYDPDSGLVTPKP